MATSKPEQVQAEREQRSSMTSPRDKAPWREPKLSFVEPKLTRHGKVEDITLANGFLGAFSP